MLFTPAWTKNGKNIDFDFSRTNAVEKPKANVNGNIPKLKCARENKKLLNVAENKKLFSCLINLNIKPLKNNSSANGTNITNITFKFKILSHRLSPAIFFIKEISDELLPINLLSIVDKNPPTTKVQITRKKLIKNHFVGVSPKPNSFQVMFFFFKKNINVPSTIKNKPKSTIKLK